MISTPRKILLINCAALAWIAILLEFYIAVGNSTASALYTIIQFLSFFTILSNILVGACATSLVLRSRSKWALFFAKQESQAATALYIGITGIIYNTVLRPLWKPEGLHLVSNELLHSVVPALFLLYWFFFAPKEKLQWKSIFPWLIFPAAYCIYTVIRGEIVGVYPYPFMNAIVLGYNRVMINIVGVIILFVVFAVLLVGIAKLVNRKIDHIL